MTKLLQTFVDGLAVGSLYALIALGYTMVYGILQFINFAHSEVFMMGAFAGLVLIGAYGGAYSPIVAGAFGTLSAMVLAVSAFDIVSGLAKERAA